MPFVQPSASGSGALTAGAPIGMSASQPIDDRQMSLVPSAGSPWPPPEYDPVSYMFRMWDAWRSGDRQKLSWTYYNLGANSPYGREFFATSGEKGLPTPRPGQFRGGLLGSIEYTFWGDPVPPGEKRTKLHVPIAADIAKTNASLLFGRAPVITSPSGNAANAAYFETLVDDAMLSRLQEAADFGAALGGVYLRIVWDTTVADKPWLAAVPADTAVPQFSYDKLKAVTFWRILEQSGDDVVRHLETHVPQGNFIHHGIYKGDDSDLGESVSLTAYPQTAQIAQGLQGNLLTFPDLPFDASTVVYVPNDRPNYLWRDLGPQAWPLGVSDYNGIESMMDSLDEAYSSWIRDLRLAKSRIIVPPSYLDNIGRGQGAVWDPSREVYSPLEFLHDDTAPTIQCQQFNIRWQEHQATCQEWINRIVQAAGYSPQTFGDWAGAAVTATEIQARSKTTSLTRAKKVGLWRPELQRAIYSLMCVERLFFGNTDITPEYPDIEFPADEIQNPLDLAQTISTIRGAGVMSLEVGVRSAHPDWSQDQIDEEVTKIVEETGLEVIGRAKVALAAPMGATLQEDIDALASSAPAPPAPPESSDDDTSASSAEFPADAG
jgi:A118 family predicted phage portal protein